jgi:hypothetical protein
MENRRPAELAIAPHPFSPEFAKESQFEQATRWRAALARDGISSATTLSPDVVSRKALAAGFSRESVPSVTGG